MADPRDEPIVEATEPFRSERPDRALLVAGLIVVFLLLVFVLMFLVAS
jgi:hypothetical protein